MELPKFLIADNSTLKEDLFIVHNEYPRFILNVSNDQIHWLEEFEKDDEESLSSESEILIKAAFAFYDREIKSLE